MSKTTVNSSRNLPNLTESRGANGIGFIPEYNLLNSVKRLQAVWIWLLLIVPQISWAAGTPANTSISNTVTVNYDIGGIAQPPATSSVSFSVDELIHPLLTWQDAAPVSVNTPGVNDALTFVLTNGGNGNEAFSLSRTNGPVPIPPTNYIPLNGTAGSIFLENNLQAGFQATGPNADTAYVSGTNDPNLAPDASQIIYVNSDTPAVASNIQGEVRLDIASLTPGAAGAPPGTSIVQGPIFAVVGTNGAQASSTGSYLTGGLGVSVAKSVLNVLDPNGGSVVMPGSILTYQLLVTLSGSGTASNLDITDPIPAETTYLPNSIIVDSAAKTDAADADNAQFIPSTVSVSLGNVAAPASHVITFRATIN
jgi:uncharacterized repeat protein (TIGR01451 family)